MCVHCAFSNVRTAELTYAARDSDFDGIAISNGDYLALQEHQLFGTDSDIEALLGRMAANDSHQNAEFITIFYGADVQASDAEKTGELFQSACPNAEVSVIRGGQPVYYYMISAE